jgi:soluble lytic murein transglycosylase-like protein
LRANRALRYVRDAVVARLLIFVMAACWSVSPALAGPFRLIDEDGVIHLTDTPNDTRYQALPGYTGTASGWLKVPENVQRAPAFAQEIRETAERYGVSHALVEAVIRAESAFNPWAVSAKGARGLMQLMPQTAYALGVRDSFNPRQNIDGGVRYLRYLLDRYPGNMAFALAAYNAGQGAVDYYRGIPPYAETQQYVKRILQGSGVVRSSGEVAAAKPEPVQPIYRYEDADGALTFSNLPPVTRPSTFPQ